MASKVAAFVLLAACANKGDDAWVEALVKTEPAGASVEVAASCGAASGATPARVRMHRSGCDVQLKLPGYWPITRPVTGDAQFKLTPVAPWVATCDAKLRAAVPATWDLPRLGTGYLRDVMWHGPVDVVTHPDESGDSPWKADDKEASRVLHGRVVKIRWAPAEKARAESLRAVFDECLR